MFFGLAVWVELTHLLDTCESQASLLGYRAVPLKNNYSEDLELASLLIKIEVFPAKVTSAEWAGPSSRVSREPFP